MSNNEDKNSICLIDKVIDNLLECNDDDPFPGGWESSLYTQNPENPSCTICGLITYSFVVCNHYFIYFIH
jgi:hypothetical protein